LHVSPAQISFNDTESSTEYKKHSLKVTNTGDEAVQYQIETISSPSIAPYGQNSSNFRLLEYSSDKFYIKYDVEVTTGTQEVSLQPGESKQIVITVKLPSDFNEKDQVMYGGYVRFSTFTSKAQVSVPYFGVLGSLYNLPTLDEAKLNIKNQEGHVYTQNETYHFDLSDKSTEPTIGFRLATPSRRFTIDLIGDKEEHVGYIVPTYNYAERNMDAQAMEELNPWNGNLVVDDNVNAKPFIVSPGKYKIRWSALRMFGDLDKSDDWVVQTSGPIDIVS
jgi:hypothetical protein